MKDNYELRQFKKRFVVCMAVSLPLIWLVSWCFCEFQVTKAFLVSGLAAVSEFVIYLLASRQLCELYSDVEEISSLMEEVVAGNVDFDAEVYKQGDMGLLYTNYIRW